MNKIKRLIATAYFDDIKLTETMTSDFDGKLRPNGQGYDIGAFEFFGKKNSVNNWSKYK